SQGDTSFYLRTYAVLADVSIGYPPPQGRFPRVTHPCATPSEEGVRLACVRHAASVRSEPGSNSQVRLRPSVPTQPKLRASYARYKTSIRRTPIGAAACSSLPLPTMSKITTKANSPGRRRRAYKAAPRGKSTGILP